MIVIYNSINSNNDSNDDDNSSNNRWGKTMILNFPVVV